jgi:hypothetical protein
MSTSTTKRRRPGAREVEPFALADGDQLDGGDRAQLVSVGIDDAPGAQRDASAEELLAPAHRR